MFLRVGACGFRLGAVSCSVSMCKHRFDPVGAARIWDSFFLHVFF